MSRPAELLAFPSIQAIFHAHTVFQRDAICDYTTTHLNRRYRLRILRLRECLFTIWRNRQVFLQIVK